MGKHEKNQKPFKVPDDAKLFAKTSLKKFQKQMLQAQKRLNMIQSLQVS